MQWLAHTLGLNQTQVDSNPQSRSSQDSREGGATGSVLSEPPMTSLNRSLSSGHLRCRVISGGARHLSDTWNQSAPGSTIQLKPQMIRADLSINPQEQLWKSLIDNRNPVSLQKMEQLLKKKPNSVQNDANYSPLSHAAERNQVDKFKLLLKNTMCYQGGMSDKALFNVCEYMATDERIECANLLLEKGWDFNKHQNITPAGMLASSGEDFSIVFRAFSDRIDVNALSFKDPRFEGRGDRMFFEDLLSGRNKDMIALVMACHEFNPVFENKENSTYITYACRYGLLDIACELLGAYPGAATMHSDKLGTPLHAVNFYAKGDELSVEEYKEFIRFFLAKGANIEEKSKPSSRPEKDAITPLQLSVAKLNAHYLQALLECGANCENPGELIKLALNSMRSTGKHRDNYIEILALLNPK